MASDNVNLPNIAIQLGTRLGIGDFGGQLLMTAITMALFLFPILMLCNKYNMNSTWPTVITGLLVISFSIYAYSLPGWILLIVGLLVGLMFAAQMRDLLTGRGGGA